MSKKLFLVLVMLLAVSLLAFGCADDTPADTGGGGGASAGSEGGGGDGAGGGGTIRIGALLPMTGSEATYGADMLNSYQMAINEINAAGGVLGGMMFEIFAEDDACDAQQAASAGAKIISSTPDFIVGGYCSGATIPALQLFADDDTAMLIGAANSTLIYEMGLYQTFLFNSPGDHQIVKFIELLDDLGVQNVAIIHQGDDYTKNLSDLCDEMLPAAGYTIVSTDVMAKGEVDISAIVNKIKNVDADLVLWCGYYADGSNVIKQLRSGGYEGYICCGDGSSDTQLIVGSGTQGEGVFVLSPPYVNFVEGGPAYIDKFRASFNADPGPYSTISYDSMYVLAEAIERAGTLDTAAVVAEIENANYQGLSGLIAFTDQHTLLHSNFIVLQINAADGVFDNYAL